LSETFVFAADDAVQCGASTIICVNKCSSDAAIAN